MTNIITSTLFETGGVSAFTIPPGDNSLSKWNINDSNIIWKGHLRLIEEELIPDEDEEGGSSLWKGSEATGDELSWFVNTDGTGPNAQKDEPMLPYRGLRLKLELFNIRKVGLSTLGNGNAVEDVVWAEVWYNPREDTGIEADRHRIANNGQDTIQMTPQSSKFYRLIVQLPGSGYHPFRLADQQGGDDEQLVQVALGLKISENFSAISFSESLSIYRRRFKNVEDQYNYEMRLLQIENKLKSLSIGNASDQQESSDDDDFGDFVGS